MFSGHLNVCCSDVSYSNPACLLFCGSNYIVHKGLGLHWRSEYQTSSVFKWLKRGWMKMVHKCYLNTVQLNHLITGQMEPYFFLVYWSGN